MFSALSTTLPSASSGLICGATSCVIQNAYCCHHASPRWALMTSDAIASPSTSMPRSFSVNVADCPWYFARTAVLSTWSLIRSTISCSVSPVTEFPHSVVPGSTRHSGRTKHRRHRQPPRQPADGQSPPTARRGGSSPDRPEWNLMQQHPHCLPQCRWRHHSHQTEAQTARVEVIKVFGHGRSLCDGLLKRLSAIRPTHHRNGNFLPSPSNTSCCMLLIQQKRRGGESSLEISPPRLYRNAPLHYADGRGQPAHHATILCVRHESAPARRLMVERGLDQAGEQRVRLGRARLALRREPGVAT